MTLTEALQNRDTFTANEAVTNSTSLSKCLDFFFLAGNHRDLTESFTEAFRENPSLALKILFWSRDVREGSGVRVTFNTIMPQIQEYAPLVFSKLYKEIPGIGYWKDIYRLKPTPELVKFVFENLQGESDHNLCAKYCPRKGWWFSELLKYANTIYPTSKKDFRKWIVNKSTTVEQQMCSQNWSDIDYEHVPSIASMRYQNAFCKHDEERYKEFTSKAAKGEVKVNSSVLYPHNIYEEWLESGCDLNLIRAQWKNLPNLMEGCRERILPLCDVSGSMKGTPMNISVALGCYISERNEGAFKDCFMTFSNQPTIEKLYGDDIVDRFRQLGDAEWGYNTDLQATFDVLLTQAIANNVPEDEMPTKILIISDMDFDSAARGYGLTESKKDITNLDAIKQKYEESGYKLPEIIFWNVNGCIGNIPANIYDDGVGLVSGYSPNILTSVLKGEVRTPYQLMLDTVDTPRYSNIHI